MERSGSSRQAVTTGEMREDDLEDFDSLVRVHRPRIFRFILASLRNRETAENLTQDCFESVPGAKTVSASLQYWDVVHANRGQPGS